jgi:hypothetical protein
MTRTLKLNMSHRNNENLEHKRAFATTSVSAGCTIGVAIFRPVTF